MNYSPLVSICIPAYNAEKFIKETIECVINQTYQNLEIIITDNCSDDSTPQIIKSFYDTRIHYIRNESNIGAQANSNKAIGLAKGKYIKLLCADDIIYPECIQLQVEIFENPQNTNLVMVCANKNVINQEGKKILTKKFPGKTGYLNGLKSIRKSIHYGTNIIGEPASVLFKRNVLESSGYFSTDNLFVMDFDLWSRMLLFGDLYAIDKVLYEFRISTSSLSTNMGIGQVNLFNKFVDKLYEDKRFKINRIDKFRGKIMSLLMGIARNGVYLISH